MHPLFLLACTSAPAEPPAPPESADEVAPEAEPEPVAAPQPPPPEPLPTEGTFRREVVPGIVVAAYDPPDVPDPGFTKPPADQLTRTDPRLFVVTVDPTLHELTYLSRRDPSLSPTHGSIDALAWAEQHDLEVVFNPGMFEPDGRATGYTRAGSFVGQEQVRRNGLYRSWFVVDDGVVSMRDIVAPKGSGRYAAMDELPAQTVASLAGAELVSQSLSIVRGGRGVYPPRKNQWSELAYGVDDEGRLVVVFSRFPYEMRELGARIAALDLGIEHLLHGEGGPEASLVVRAGGIEWVQMGSYETGFYGDDNHHLWSLPAVIGVRPKD